MRSYYYYFLNNKIYSDYFDYLLFLLFRGSWSVELERAFYYAPCPLIDQAPGNDATSLTMYTTHTRTSDTRKYIYIYTLNPVESNYRDGHNNTRNDQVNISIYF